MIKKLTNHKKQRTPKISLGKMQRAHINLWVEMYIFKRKIFKNHKNRQVWKNATATAEFLT